MNPLRVATQDDVDVIADLIQAKRLQYENYQPIFWRVAPSARDNHLGFLAKMLANERTIAWVWGGNPRDRGRVHYCQHHCRAAGL